MPVAERAALAERSKLVVLHDHGEPTPGTTLTIAVTGDNAGPDRLTGLGLRAVAAALLGPTGAQRPRATIERILVTTGGGALQDAGIEIATRASAPRRAMRGCRARTRPLRGVHGAGGHRPHRRAVIAAGAHAGGRRRDHRGGTDGTRGGRGRVPPPSLMPMVANERRNAQALRAAGAAHVVEPGEEVAGARGSSTATRWQRAGTARRGWLRRAQNRLPDRRAAANQSRRAQAAAAHSRSAGSPTAPGTAPSVCLCSQSLRASAISSPSARTAPASSAWSSLIVLVHRGGFYPSSSERARSSSFSRR